MYTSIYTRLKVDMSDRPSAHQTFKTNRYLPTLYCPICVQTGIMRRALLIVKVTAFTPVSLGAKRGTGQITVALPIWRLQLSSCPSSPNLILAAVAKLSVLVLGPVTTTKPPVCTAPKDGVRLMLSAARKEST